MAEIKVSCEHCGQHIQCDERYCGSQINCPTCKQSFFVPQLGAVVEPPAPPLPRVEPALTIRRHPRLDYVAEAKTWEAERKTAVPVLWNPYAAAIWSVLFSPIFGAIIHARNADALGRTKEAKANRVWFYISLFYFLALGGAYCFANPQDEKGLNGISRFMSLALLFGWFYHVGKKQAKYVKEDLAQNYKKKSWLAPLSIAFGIFIPLMFAAVYGSDSFSKAKQIAESGQQHVGLENLESEVKASIETKLAQDPATSSTRINSFKLVHENGNKYKGMLIAQTDGKSDDVEVDVTYDGRTFMWKILPQNASANPSVNNSPQSAIDPNTGPPGGIDLNTGLPLSTPTKESSKPSPQSSEPPIDPATGLAIPPK